jgi:predicted outer membrane repeat protein
MTLFAQKKNIFNIFASIAFLASLFFYHVSFGDVVMTVDDPTDTVADNGLCSIVEALINSSAGDQSGSVDCPAGDLIRTTINLQTDVTLINEWPNIPGYGYTLAGPGADFVLNGNGHTISRDFGASDLGIWRIVGVYEYEFNDVIFSNGSAVSGDPDTNKGGALNILAPESVLINNVIFENNTAEDGGSIYVKKDSSPLAVLEIIDSEFTTNSSTNSGGAINVSDITMTVDNTVFMDNSSNGGGNGGHIYLNNTDLDINSSYFVTSSSSGTIAGGGVYSISSAGNTLTINASTFEGLLASTDGSAISVESNISVTLTNNTFFNNNAIGGATITLEGGSNTINASFNTFFGNSANSSNITDLESIGTQLSGVFENNIFANSSNGNLCGGDLTNFTFTNNIADVDDADCGLTDSSPTGIASTLSMSGGSWSTISLSSGSNAIDTAVSGTLGCPATDGRGVPRPYNVACDIGAYEYTGEVSVIVSESGGSTEVSESGTLDTYTIVLGKGPTSSVTINISESDPDIETSPSSLTFTTLDWFTPQTVTISAVDNADDDGDRTRTISHSVSTSDIAYTLITPSSVSVFVSDDDSSGSITSSGSSSTGPSNPVTPVVPVVPFVFPGCTDPLATNYASWANQDNGTCVFPSPEVPGCTNPSATNYNSSATENNGSCVFEEVTPPEIIPEPEIAPEDPAPVVPTPSEEPNPPATPNETENPSTPEEPEKLNINSLKNILIDIFVGINIQTEDVKKTAEPVSVLGVALPTLIFVATQPAVAASIPIRLWSIFPTLLGFKRRKRPWGTVYDSVTKQPLDPVHVTLFDESGKEVATTITDLDGRFGFLVPAGKYKISAHKDNYEFPSKKMLGKQKDELYGDLYFNELVEVKGEEDILIKNIPMDSVKFNWNEFEKGNNKKLMKFYSKRELFFANISSVTFYAGVVSSIFLMFTAPAPINLIIFGIYVVVFLLRLFGLRPKKPGYVFDASGFPLSFGVIKIFSAGLNREVAHAVIGKTGKYYSLVPNGQYYMKILKKTGEDQYIDVHTTEIFKVSEGYIKEKINV